MRVEMIDKITAPAKRAGNAVNDLIEKTKVGFGEILTGGAGIWGVGLAFNAMTNDYREFYKEIAGVRTLGVAEATLNKLGRTALSFSIRYGESAAAFVNSSYEIQSAIAGLSGDELIRFTEAGNVLAKGAKADAATITNYMGTMYGIFQNTADKMGRARWIEVLTGQTSMAVDIFKSDGMQMSAAFTSLGADAQAHGIAINEQMAVLGQLQATMSGSEAGTKYKAFLRGVGAAQKELGLRFTDSGGRMLPVNDILAKLQGKFGAIDTVAKSDALKKAFGSDEAVATIKLLLNNTSGLSDAITEIGKVNGMEQARWKAEQLADPLARLQQGGTAVRISFGALVEKALMPFYHAGIEHLALLNKWINKYPHLFGFLAKVTLGIMALTAVVAALAVAKGVGIIAMAGYTVGLSILKIALVPFGPLLRAIRYAWVMFNFQLAVGTKLLPAAAIALKVFRNTLLLSTKAAWAFAAALLANPVTWIVVGVVALVAGLVMLVKNWDAVKAAAVGALTWITDKWTAFRSAIEQTTVLKFLFAPLFLTVDLAVLFISTLAKIPAFLMTIGTVIYSAVVGAIDWVIGRWNAFTGLIQDNVFLSALFMPLTLAIGTVDLLITALEKIPTWFEQFKKWLSDLNPFEILNNIDQMLVGALNLIPGINIEAKQAAPVVPGAVAANDSTWNRPSPLSPQLEQATNPLKTPAAVKVVEPVNIPARVQVTEPVKVPVVAAPAPVKVPESIARADAANEKVERERADLMPPPAAPMQNVPPGGLQQQFNTANSNRTTHIGSLNVNTTQKVDGYSIADQLRMAGG